MSSLCTNCSFRVDPILFETVILGDEVPTSKRKEKFELFMAHIDCKPPEFYAQHVKNLWIRAPSDPDAFERILTVCSGVENLVLFPGNKSDYFPFVPFLEHPNAGSHLRRLTCKLEYLFPPSMMPNFNYPCFTNLTHLHLYDEIEDWPAYVGFEHLCSLTHLALSCCRVGELAIVMQKLPALKYVAICSYVPIGYGRCHLEMRYSPIEDVCGDNVVVLEWLTIKDWEREARGGPDFWEIVEREVAWNIRCRRARAK